MRKKKLFILVMVVLAPGAVSFAIKGGVSRQRARPFVGQDLHLSGREVISYQSDSGEHTLVFQDGFSMSIGANQFFSDSAVVWLEEVTIEFFGRTGIDYKVRAYLQGSVSVKKGKGAKTTDLSQTVVEDSRSMVVQFDVSGEVFVTAEKRKISDPRGLELYKKAEAAVVPVGPKFVVQPEALVPELPREKIWPERPAKEKEVVTAPPKPKKEVVAVPPKPEKVRLPAPTKPRKPGLLERVFGRKKKPVKPAEVVAEPEVKRPRFMYPVNIAPAGEVEPKIERAVAPEGTDVATVIGRFYVWQKQDEEGDLLELEADNAVIFYSGQERSGEEQAEAGDVLAKGGVRAIYMSGDVVMTEGQRTIRADEMYYDFQSKKALAVNAVMRNFDVERGIPIYVRAMKLRRIAEDKFSAENAVLTTSEFYLPQISLTASSVLITDTTTIDAQAGRVSDSSYDVQMRDVRLKLDDRTIFYWPFVRSNLERPDVPLKSVHTGYDSDWGMLVETRWYLSRLLGLREPEGTDSTFALDYYGERGIGTGAEIDYVRENYFGRLLGYVIRDTGEDDLGRRRKNLKPPRKLRGRFLWRHRHFLPYNWQLTTEVSYASDEHFIEGYYRSEFDVGKEQETLVHLKRIEDNWGLSILGKARINNFVNKLEELPTAEFHWTGQSFLDDKLTFYSDSQVSRFRQRLASASSSSASQEFFTFMSERAEVDMPIKWGSVKVVPFVAGTVGYEDGRGFYTNIDGSTAAREDEVWIGEAGIRFFPQPYWKVYPDVKSRLWDLNGLRHIIRPYLVAVCFTESDSVAEQRDMLHVGISQRLQTKRGSGGNQRIVDWMRLDMEATWLSDSADASDSGPGPDRFIWNKPFIPLVDRFSTEVPQQDRRSSNIFGPRRNYFSADYIWRISDTSALLSDINFDIQSGVVQQFNIGFSRLCWPNLSYYIGSRYLRRVENDYGEKGSNMFTFAATYALDPRYTVVFSQQLDFDYGATIRSDISLIRRYHRMYWALTYSADESLDREAIIFSIWPQGVPELAIGGRRYMGLTGPAGY